MAMALRSSEPLTAPPRPGLVAVPNPDRGQPLPTASRPASVLVLHPPVDSGPAAPLRLTRRGVLVVSLVAAAVGVALVWLAAVSAPRPATSAGTAQPRVVTVRPGDTLWSIATRLAPDSDPQAEVAVLQRVNHLAGVQLRPGQRLRTG